MNFLLLAIIGIAAGTLPVVQSALNARLTANLGAAFTAIFYNFLIGTGALLIVCMISRAPLAVKELSSPLWPWLGGVVGATFVLSMNFLIPRVGAANMVALLVLGQTIAALFVDHYGLLGVPIHGASPSRIVACGLMLVAVVLMR